jgi:hypothetical protein
MCASALEVTEKTNYGVVMAKIPSSITKEINFRGGDALTFVGLQLSDLNLQEGFTSITFA